MPPKLLVNTAAQNGTAGLTVTRLRAERDAAVEARAVAGLEWTAYENRVQRTNQELVNALQTANQADSRRIRAETAAQTAEA